MSKKSGFWTEAEIRGRLSMSTLVFYKYRPICERSLKTLTENGIRQIELLESPEQYDMTNSRSMGIMGELFRSCGIEVVAYHAHNTHFNDIDSEHARAARADVCKKQIDTMLDMGGRVWACHAGEADSYVTRTYEELARYIEGTDISIAVENFGSKGTGVEDRVEFIDALNHPRVGMILDIGHVRNDHGENPIAMPGGPTEIIGLCGKHLRHVHLHGFKDGRDHHPPMTDGDTIQWAELFRRLYEADYPGAINFEPAGEPTHSTSLSRTSMFPHLIVEMIR